MDNNVLYYKKRLIYFTIGFLITTFVGYFLYIYIYENSKTINAYSIISNLILSTKTNSIDIKISKDNFILDELQKDNLGLIMNQNLLNNQKINNQINNFLANIETINTNFDLAYEKYNGDNWQYYFNVGNTKLIQGYYNLSGDSINTNLMAYSYIKDSIPNYDIALDLLLTGSSNYSKINQNKTLAYKIKYLAGIKGLLLVVKDFVSRFSSIEYKTGVLSDMLENQLSNIKKLLENTNDQDTILCLQKLNKDLSISMLSINNITKYIRFYKDGLFKVLKTNIDSPQKLMDDSQSFISPIKLAIEKVSKSIDGFIKQIQSINAVLGTNNQDAIKFLCNADNPGNEAMENINKNLNKGLDDLNKMLGDNVQKGEQNDTEQQQSQSSQSNNQQIEHQKIPDGFEQQIMNMIKKESDSWVKQMNDIKKDSKYTPDNYLKQLFKDFFGNSKDFTNYTGGSLEKFDNNR